MINALNNTTRVLKFILIETGTYEDAMLRPYTTQINNENHAIDLLRETTNNGQFTTPAALSDVAGHLLTQSAQPEGMCAIPNNWDSRRLRFFLEIEYNSNASTRNRQILSGYTDHSGFSNLTGSQVHFDPNMRVYFNNSITLRDSMFTNPDGSRAYRTTMADDSQILRAGQDTYGNLQGQAFNSANVFALRPEDLFASQSAASAVLARGGGDIWDTRASFSMGARKSTRDNAIPSRYLSKSITALGQAYTNVDVANEPSQAVFNAAHGAVRERAMYQDQFFGVLSNQTNYSQQGWATYQELCMLLPGLDETATFLRPGSLQQSNESYSRGRHEHWQGSGTETLFASRVVAAVPGIMIENMLTNVGFFATNRTMDGRFSIQPYENSAKSFTDGLDLTMFLNRFEQTLVLEVLNTLTSNSLIDIDLSLVVDIAGETYVSISIGGAPAVEYTQATFCDALYAPVMTINAQSVNNIGEDIANLVSFINVTQPQFGVGQGNPGPNHGHF